MFKVFIANLRKYNEGNLVGEWIDLPISENDLEKVLEIIGIDGENYEEYFFPDHEIDIDYDIPEYEDIDDLNDVAEQLENLTYFEKEVFSMLFSNGYSFDKAISIAESHDFFLYEDCEDMEDVARTLAEMHGMLENVPEELKMYIDYESMGEDMDINGEFYKTSCGMIEMMQTE